jgi:2-keto-3-deoxy-L-rhamnonate aldolase RhmA
MTASFAERLRRGDTLIGTLVSLPCPPVVELLAATGYDWLFLDAEHGPFMPGEAQSLLQAAGDCPCLIRVPASDDVWIKKALDIGAAGIIVPQVHTPEQASAVVRSAKYSPQGSRGVGLGRAHRYGLRFEEYLRAANRDSVIVIQAESRAAVDNIGQIAATPGIDAILIGPYDLSASLGHIGEVAHSEVKDAISSIRAACINAGVRLGIFGVNPDAVLPYMQNGFTLITAGVDTLLLHQAAAAALAQLKGQHG